MATNLTVNTVNITGIFVLADNRLTHGCTNHSEHFIGMSQDLEEYQNIIEQLKPMINEPEFNQVLAQVASRVPKQKRFLIKMELKRLARPCIRLIDLRGQVAGECRLYEYEGRSHYLDDTAIEVFERQVRSFGDYTIGVYEAVKNTENNFRVMHKNRHDIATDDDADKEKHAPYSAPVVTFGNYAKRSEERMNYAVSIELFNELNKSIQATSVDISVSGLKLKIKKEESFKIGEKVIVQFRGLEGEYTIDKKNGLPYTVVGTEKSKKELKVCLKRVEDTPNASFDSFLQQFIHGNKRRYKVNMDNTFEAIKLKTYEQYYTPNFTSVPVYIETIEGQYQPKYVLANDSNKEAIYYWSDEQYDLKLGYIFSHKRIASLLNKPEGQQETYIYAFNHVKDEKVYFYSATQEELAKRPELMSVFLGYGARKASWRVYKVKMTDMSMDQAHLPLSIPDSISDSVKRQNQPPTPRLLARIKHLTHIALLTDITDDAGTKSYEKIQLKRNDIANLKLFGHPRNKPPAAVNMFRFKYFNQRKETRYQLRSKVQVKLDDIVLEGVSEDVSVRGLKIELHSFFHDVENALVKISFPMLQKVTKKYDLSELPYRVKGMSNDRNVLHVQAVNDLVNTTAQRFFDELIKNNRSRLKAYREEEEIPGIGSVLRNLYTSNALSTAFFIRKEGVDFVPDAIATSKLNPRLNSLLKYDAEPGRNNLRFLYNSNGVDMDFIQFTLKKIKTNNKPIMKEVMVAFDPSQSKTSDAIRSRFTNQFKDDNEQLEFIEEAMENGQFIALKVFLARTGRPDTERLQSEINYVGVYAIHRAKVLEEQLWNVVGIGDIVDVTDEVLTRLQFKPKQILQNHKAPIQHKVETSGVEKLLKA